MTDAQKREAARQFYQKWAGKGNENQDCQRYWIDILQSIMGISNVTDVIRFEKTVIVSGHQKMIDAYLTDTKVLIEQKSVGISLDKKIHQSGDIDLTPYEQAKRYYDHLPFEERGRWIVTSNFSEIWVYDMNMPVPAPEKIEIINLQTQYNRLNFLVNSESTKISEEMKVSLQAGELVGAMYDAFLKQYKDPESEQTLKSLNKLCVRIVFCLYAEDAGIFGRKDLFHDYLVQFDAKKARAALSRLFKVLDQKPEERDPYLADDDTLLASFPYVNGGLFADEDIEIPPFTDEILDLILRKASDDFDWSQISPTIFGAVFESTLNPETRRAGGMHYTSIENIHKVIDLLFLDDLKAELAEISSDPVKKTRDKKLQAYQKRLASLKWLDPAAGSGNFLTETYISVRRLENEAIKLLTGGQMMVLDAINPIQVSISQFYGIEINDFAVTVAKTALWIAESQMMKETEDIVLMNLDFLPLKTNANIVEGNALRLDWETIVPKNELNYIMGNPPFVGASYCTSSQKKEIVDLFGKIKLSNSLDYVSGWYYKASEYIAGTVIRCSFVSTNSITQGEQVSPIWKTLSEKFSIHFDFAYRTFIWDSEASEKAHVHVVIIGFSSAADSKHKMIIDDDSKTQCENINFYLMDAPNCFIESRSDNLCNMPRIIHGSKPSDGGYLILTPDEKDDLISKDPEAAKFIRRYSGGADFLRNQVRYCLWLEGFEPGDFKGHKEIIRRIEGVRKSRLASSAKATQSKAETPTLFFTITQPKRGNMLVGPQVSSGRRRYIPFGFYSSDIIASDKLLIMPDADLYIFGIMMSNVHNSWVRAFAGRLKSDFTYSVNIVYNNFPWPNNITSDIRQRIEQTAQAILDVREKYPNSSLSDLYDPNLMPSELRKAHESNDRAVMKAYGFSIKDTSESDCVAALMKMYQELTQKG